ncbi:MAG: TatD family nuclease-associated radical SAM protein [Clostridia bacterium]|nr:TatD family nuclease-associated radical SAM protein [Clostridia bacterium]
MDTYTYQIGDNLYVNLTNRCSNRCTFCVREQGAEYEGYSLWLSHGEPTAEQVIEQIGDPTRYREIVFCGYGEPTYRLDAMLKICDYVHSRGGKTRLNTNGHGNLIQGKNIAGELATHLDGINVSLNAPEANAYNELCKPCFSGAFEELLRFAAELKRAGGNVWFSVVDCIGEERVNKCRAVAEKVGVPLRVREMIGK